MLYVIVFTPMTLGGIDDLGSRAGFARPDNPVLLVVRIVTRIATDAAQTWLGSLPALNHFRSLFFLVVLLWMIAHS
jgi:hypothetical protein